MYWRGDTQKGRLGCCSFLYDSPLLLWSGLYSGMCIGTHKLDASPSSHSLGNVPKKLLCFTPSGIREKHKSNKGLGGMQLNQSGMPSGLPLVHLHFASVVESGGMNKVPASVRDRLSLTREGKLQWKVCLHPYLE